jgi:hypothetical protein
MARGAAPIVVPHPLSWRNRGAQMIVALLLAVLALRLIWGWHLDRLARAQAQDLRRRGQPVEFGDLLTPPIPDDRNAWKIQLRAAAALAPGVASPLNSNMEYAQYPPFGPKWTRRAEASERANAAAFALAREARRFSAVRFRTTVPPSWVTSNVPDFGPTRQLACTLADGALLSQTRGDDAEAVERTLDLLHLARSVNHDDFLVSQLVAVGINGLAYVTIEALAPGLRIEPAPPTTAPSPPVHPATRRQVRQLIAQLLDDSDDWAGFRRCLYTESMPLIDTSRVLTAHAWLVRPIADINAVRTRREMQPIYRAAEATNKPDADAILAASRNGGRSQDALDAPTPSYSRSFDNWYILAPSIYRTFETHFRAIAERRIAAISLACQLYRNDHGRWPARLEDLAPDYLPSLPTDPFRNDGHTFGYTTRAAPRTGAPRPLVFFDPEPAAADNDHIPDEPMYGWTPKLGRQYSDLSRFEPLTPTVEHDPDESGAPGQQPQEHEDSQQP